MVKNDPDKISNYFDYNIDIDNRRIFLSDDIEDLAVCDVVKGLYLLDKIKADDTTITLFLDSYGGSDYSMYRLYDAIHTISSAVETVAMGKVMSACPLLVAAGTKGMRYSTENTFFMIHDFWVSSGDDRRRLHDSKKELEHYTISTERWASLMERHTKRDAKFWLKLCKNGFDTYFGAECAIEYGIIDEIWKEK